MIAVLYHKNFLKSVKNLPEFQQKKLSKLIEVLRENPFNPLLHTKRLTKELAGSLSFRVTRNWRVIFQFLNPGAVQLLRVKHRKDIYR